MPQYKMPEKETITYKPAYRIMINGNPADIHSMNDLDKFTQGYIEALFFTENSHLDSDEFLTTDSDSKDGTIPNDVSWLDFSQDTIEKIIEDCQQFYKRYSGLIKMIYEDESYAGHDFWLSRNGHGAGFFDRHLDVKTDCKALAREIGDKLQSACGWQTDFPEINVYFGDDGKIYI